MKIYNTLIIFLLVYLYPFPLVSLDIHLVKPEIITTGENTQSLPDLMVLLPESVNYFDTLNTIHIKSYSHSNTIGSLIDAGSLAMADSLDYVLYGSIHITSQWYETKLSFYETETDRVRTVFYSKDSIDRIGYLADDLGKKITKYIYGEFGISERILAKPSEGYVQLSLDPGYWGIISPTWSDILISYFNVGISGKVVLPEPRAVFDGNEIYPRFGLLLGYAFGKNKSEVEPYSYHSFQMGIPIEITLNLRNLHNITLSAAPGYQIDYLHQERKYGDEFNSVSSAFFVKTSLNYSFAPHGKDFSIGVNNAFDFCFYKDLMISYKPSIQISYNILKLGKETYEK